MRLRVGLAFLAVIIFSGLASCVLLTSCGKKGAEGVERTGMKPSYDSLVVRVTLNEGSYAIGENIIMKLTAVNNTDSRLRLTFPTAQRFDFVVRKGRRPLWQWSHGRVFAQAVSSRSIAPRDSLSYEVIWDQTTVNGTKPGLGAYSVQGILKTLPEIATEERIFGIVD